MSKATLCKKCGSQIYYNSQLYPGLCVKCAIEELDKNTPIKIRLKDDENTE